jgi:hypothetical protein
MLDGDGYFDHKGYVVIAYDLKLIDQPLID